MGQGYKDHLVTQEANIPEVDRVQWKKIDAQLCNVLWQSVDPKILLHLRAYKTCFKFWNQAKGYTQMISNVFIRWLLLLSMWDNKTWIYLLILARLPLLRRNSWMWCLLLLMLGSTNTDWQVLHGSYAYWPPSKSWEHPRSDSWQFLRSTLGWCVCFPPPYLLHSDFSIW